jgi:hypothetical protein
MGRSDFVLVLEDTGFAGRNRLVWTRCLEVVVSFAKEIKTVATDSHFLVPLCVLVLGITLLAVLH